MTHPRLAVFLRVFVFVAAVVARAAEPPKLSFDLPAGPIEVTLKKFSAQAGVDVLFASQQATRVQTRAVVGDYTARQAIDRLLDGTGLSASQNEQTGAFTIHVAVTVPPAPAPSPPKASDAVASEQVVRMEDFKVNTTIGAYHEETSSMASKLPTNLKELPSSLQILNSNAITDRNATSLQDVYGYIIGLTQTQKNANGFNFRGFASTGQFTQNIEYDGLQGGASSHGAVSAANVESVEFLKGPNSVLYGQMQPGGLMNIVSKSPRPSRQTSVRGVLNTYAGGFNSFGDRNGYTLTVDTTGPVDAEKKLLYRFIVSGDDFQLFRKDSYNRNLYFFPSFTYRFSDDTFATVKMEAIQEKRRRDDGLVAIFTTGIAYGPEARFTTAPLNTVYNDPTDVDRDRGEVLATQFQTKIGSWTVRAQTRSVWHMDFSQTLTADNRNTFFPTAQFAKPTTTLRRQYNYLPNGHRYNFFDLNTYGHLGPESFSHVLLLGVGGGSEFSATQRFAFGPNVTPAITLLNPALGQTPYPPTGTGLQSNQVNLNNFGEYISDQMKIGERLHVSLGLRHDQQQSHGLDVFKPATSPYVHQFVSATVAQAGFVADVTSDLSLYASWSQSFAPTLVTTIDASGRSGFPPQKGEQFETGAKFETVDRRFYGSLALYQIKRSNVPVNTGTQLPTGQSISRLDGGQTSEGIELESQWQPLPYLQIQGGLAFGKAFTSSSLTNPNTVGLDVINAPRASGNFWTRYNVPRGRLLGLGMGLGLVYRGKIWGGDPTGAVYFPLPGWTRTDASVFYKWHRWDFALNIQNLFDRRYLLSPQTFTHLIPGDERKISLSFNVRF